jgi:hypothetical protein
VKRWISPKRIALFLLLLAGGAAVNVAVAWGCAILIDPFIVAPPSAALRNVREPWRGQWIASRLERPGMMRLDTRFNRAKSPWGPVDAEFPQPDLGDPAALVPRWTGRSAPSAEFLAGDREIELTFVDARGWPMLSLWHMPLEFITIRVPDKFARHAGRGGFALPLPAWTNTAPFSSWPSEPRTLPLRIIPLGFLFNTLFYAGVLWMIFAAPPALRRRRRIRLGLCPKCAYDLRGMPSDSSTCPECGTRSAA